MPEVYYFQVETFLVKRFQYCFSKDLLVLISFFFSYAGGYNACEFGDFTVVHALTGWLPEIIPLR